MASVLLKRKGGELEGIESPKRVKSISTTKTAATKPLIASSGWDAFDNLNGSKELVKVNGISADGTGSGRESASPDVEDFDAFIEQGELEKQNKNKKSKAPSGWKISEPIGGRLISVDPVFSEDEKYIIVAGRVSLHVYSTSTSLLARTIRLQIDLATRTNTRIVTYCMSPTSPNLIWVACSDGAIYSIDWTTGAGSDQYWGISSTGCIHMTVASMLSAGRRRDVVFTTELRKDNGWRITANELAPPGGPIATVARTIYTSTQKINFLKTAKEGSVIVAASEKRVLLGNLRSTEYDTIDKIRYEFRVFESSDLISSLDVRAYERKVSADSKKGGKMKAALKKIPVVDVVVGDVKGSIFVHNDLLSNLIQAQGGSAPAMTMLPRKLHWHRQAVCSVKWSADGNYIISGGTETVLVLWQLDTGKRQMLPHMSATIENIVISPTGSSYGIRLADNSTMVLSTAELKPTANIAGIQAPVLQEEAPIASRVQRVEEEAWQHPLIQRTPAVINPHNPSQLLLGVGHTQEVDPLQPPILSTPFMQTFDLASGHHLSRQAFARSNITNVNIAPNAHRISEPRITHMQISYDGKWLATIDEWLPPRRDLEYLGHTGKNLEEERHKRREVFLKFWQWSEEADIWELVSRIDSPHASAAEHKGAGRVLDLCTDPSSLRFSTIGEDGFVRTWETRTRKRDGVVVRSKNGVALRNWTCHQSVNLGKSALQEVSEIQATNSLQNGCVSFSGDGSILAVAFGNTEEGMLHMLDPDSGAIRTSRADLFGGEIIKMAFLNQDLITLSDFLVVYDLVEDETRYSIQLSSSVATLALEQKMEMMHLSVDHTASTFAVVLPAQFGNTDNQQLQASNLLTRHSEFAVFKRESRLPILKETFSTLITALLPAADNDGYVIVDSAAEIRTILEKGKQTVIDLAQPTSELQPSAADEGEDLLTLVKGVEEEEQENAQETTLDADDDDEEGESRVVTKQELSKIFDIGPAYALPSMEDMFYQVAGLFLSKPVRVA